LIAINAFVKKGVMQAKVIRKNNRNHPEYSRMLERKAEYALEI
jgi:hypothetical protein